MAIRCSAAVPSMLSVAVGQHCHASLLQLCRQTAHCNFVVAPFCSDLVGDLPLAVHRSCLCSPVRFILPRVMMRSATRLLILSGALLPAGCAMSGPQCKTGIVLLLSPASGSADSSAKAPSNQTQFQASSALVVTQQGSGSCPVPAIAQLIHPQWSNPDPIHITISSADDSTNGLATCNGATAGPVTLTATEPSGTIGLGPIPAPLTGTVQLTCR